MDPVIQTHSTDPYVSVSLSLSRVCVSITRMVSRTDFDICLITDRGRILPQSYDCVVKLFPGENFSIVATNNTNLKTKAKFYLSGTYVGTLVIPKFQKCELKRPIEGVDRCFIYCEFGTSIAEKAKLDPNKPHSDEVTIIFLS